MATNVMPIQKRLKAGAWAVAELVLLVLALAGLAAWIYQVTTGLVVTNMTDLAPWGLYIVTFMFLVGLSAGGLIVASAGEVFGVARLKPLAPLAIWLSLICIGLAGLSVLLDLGSPQRVYQLITNPQWSSPLMWDVVAISLYLLLSVAYLWLHARQDRVWVHRLAYVALPAAVLVHAVTAWIFGLQISRAYWYSALLAPSFVSSALVSGLGLFILAILLARKAKVVEASDSLVSWLGGLLAVFIVVDMFFLLGEFLTRLYPGASVQVAAVEMLLSGRNAPLFWAEVLLGLVLPVVLLAFRKLRANISLVGLSAVLAIAGILLKRWNILAAGFAYPLDAFPGGVEALQVLPWTRLDSVAQAVWVPSIGGSQLSLAYTPTLIEFVIVVGLVAAGALVWLLGLQILPLRAKRETAE